MGRWVCVGRPARRPTAFEHWARLRDWIDTSYPDVFVPEWLYGGKKRGWSLRYKKTKAFCALLPGYSMKRPPLSRG